jgi:hypothetical protein
MLMGSTQGESFNIAHYGAFYGATVDGGLDRAPTSYSRISIWIIKYIYGVKIKPRIYLHVPPHVCRRIPPPGRMPTKHCRMPHTPFHSIVTIYDTPPLTLFSETSTSDAHCS